MTTGVGQWDDFLWLPLRNRLRFVAAGSAVVAALAHVPVIPEHLREAPYMGEEFVVLTVACLLLALVMLICDSRAAYVLTTVTCSLAIVGYAATRLVTFPLLDDDLGNWLEPLGVVSILSEAVTVAVAVIVLRQSRRG